MVKPIPKDCVSFMMSKILIGESIAHFFFNREFPKAMLEYDYKNKSLIIEGMNAQKIASYKYKIVQGLPISVVRLHRKNNTTSWTYFIQSTGHTAILDFSRREMIFKARPISKDKLIVENIPFADIFNFRYKCFVMDPINSKIVFHSLIRDDMKHTSRLKLDSLSLTEKFIERAKQRRIQNQSNIIQNELKNLQPKIPDGVKDTIDKETGNIWGFEKPVGNLPSPEQRLEADKVYSKMILGE